MLDISKDSKSRIKRCYHIDIIHIYTYHILLPLTHIMLGNWNNSNVSFYSSVELNVILIHTLSLYRIRKMVSPHSSKCQKFIHHFTASKMVIL